MAYRNTKNGYGLYYNSDFDNNEQSYGYEDDYSAISKSVTKQDKLSYEERLMGNGKSNRARREVSDNEYVAPSGEATMENTKKSSGRKKNTIIFICYILLIVAVVAIIIANFTGANGVSFFRKSGENASADVNTDKFVEIDNNVLYKMNVNDEISEVSPIPTETNTTKEDTNWFDDCCDWVNEAIGG